MSSAPSSSTIPGYYKWLAMGLALVVVAPLLMTVDSMWDNDTFAMYYHTGDRSYFSWIIEHGWYIPRLVYDYLGRLYHHTGIYPRIIMAFMSAIAVLGLTRESYVFLRERFEYSQTSALFGAAGVMAYPVWHILLASHLSITTLVFWFFMVAVNQRAKRPLLALSALFISFQLFSVFSFAIGILATDFLMTTTRSTYRRKIRDSIVYCALFLAGYIALTHLINVNGIDHNYNVIKPSITAIVLLKGITAALLATGLIYLLHGRSFQSAEAQRDIRIILSFVALAFFAGFAYWAVGRPTRFFSFGSFGGRHTILMCIPFSVLLAFCAEKITARFSLKALHLFAALILTTLVVLLYQGYNHKAAALLFKDMLEYSFKQINEPKNGYVSIVEDGYKAPRHVHLHSINFVMYKAFGKSNWMANGFWARRGHEYSLEDLKQKYPPGCNKKKMLAGGAHQENFTKFKFSLKNYHQEGRSWYWYNYLFKNYDTFKPKLTQIEFRPE